MSHVDLHHSWSRLLFPQVNSVILEKSYTGGWIKSGIDRMRDVSREQWIMLADRPFDSSLKDSGVCKAIAKSDLHVS